MANKFISKLYIFKFLTGHKEFVYAQRFYLGILLLVILFNLFVLDNSDKGTILLSESAPSQVTLKNWEPESIARALEKKPYLSLSISLLALVGVFAFLAGVVINVKYIARRLKNKNVFKFHSGLEPAKWGIWDVCKIAILFLFFSQIIYIFEHLFFPLDIYLRMIINTFILNITVIALVIFAVTIACKQNLKSLGLSRKDWMKNVIMGIVGYVALLPTLFLIILVVFVLARKLNYQPPVQPLFDLFLVEQRGVIIILSVILITVLGPIGEEIFFRGFMYKAIRNKISISCALILSAAIFAGLHNNLIGFFPIMALAMLLAYLYEKSGSLIPSITAHIIHNSLVILFVLLTREIGKLI